LTKQGDGQPSAEVKGFISYELTQAQNFELPELLHSGTGELAETVSGSETGPNPGIVTADPIGPLRNNGRI
jgi:hypothetical protein